MLQSKNIIVIIFFIINCNLFYFNFIIFSIYNLFYEHMKEAKPTYDALLKKIKEQELEIDRLLKKEESLASFKFFIEESNDLVCIVGIDAFFKEINPAFVEILGYSKEELLKDSLLHLLHPDDLERSLKEIESLAMGKPSINYENRFIKKEW